MGTKLRRKAIAIIAGPMLDLPDKIPEGLGRFSAHCRWFNEDRPKSATTAKMTKRRIVTTNTAVRQEHNGRAVYDLERLHVVIEKEAVFRLIEFYSNQGGGQDVRSSVRTVRAPCSISAVTMQSPCPVPPTLLNGG